MARNRYYQGPVTDHFDGVRFHGPGRPIEPGWRDLYRLFRTPFADWPPQAPLAPAQPVPRVEGAALRVTSIGHASHLIQTRGLNILVDPVLGDRASPFGFAGPKRVRPPALTLETLPAIDVLLVTHNHYDHLEPATLESVQRSWPACRIIVPLGNDTIIKRHDPTIRVAAHDWNDRVSLSTEVGITLVPCHHWSARGLGDRRMALWAAFLIDTPDGAIYHIGDTGYPDSAIFRDIPRRFGPPRLAILPIGAYDPRWFMRPQHVDPDEAVAIFRDCQAAYALAHHWGTFRLTAEPIDEPPQRLAAALTASGIAADRFRIQRPGEVFEVPKSPLNQATGNQTAGNQAAG